MPSKVSPEANQAVTVMAFDYGLRRVGVAVGNALTKAGQPLKTIAAPNVDALFQEIQDLIKDWQPQQLVVGRPVHPDGTEHEMTAKATRFGNQLKGRFHLPVVWVDERYTSVMVEGGNDALAAQLILQQYLQEL